MTRLAEILQTLSNWGRKWSAVRRQAMLWCRSKPNRFLAPIREQSPRINLRTKPTQLVRHVLSAHTFAERIRAIATFPNGGPAHCENLLPCWASARRDFTMM